MRNRSFGASGNSLSAEIPVDKRAGHSVSRMKISIVTLSFNQGAYLRQAIESVLQQGYADLEYIIVDPGSTDGSRELIQGYSASLSRVIFEPDCGAADGLNKGFSRATGEVFGFLNADDLLMPGALCQVADLFHRDPLVDLAFGNGFVIDGSGLKLRHYRARGFTARRYFYGGAQWLQQSTFFRSGAFLRSEGFNTANKTCWDGELFLTMVGRGARVGYIDSDLAAFRIHQGSISGSSRMAQQFKSDWRRIFRQVQGRDWTLIDDLRRIAGRAAGFISRISAR
jgi:glycosyltransferase involved in cell wall biosynthesis